MARIVSTAPHRIGGPSSRAAAPGPGRAPRTTRSASETFGRRRAAAPAEGLVFFPERMERVMEPWHAKSISEVSAALGADLATGLGSAEAALRLEKYGPNRLAAKKGKSLLVRVLEQFRDFLIYILLAAAVVSILLGEVSDAVIILIVVAINAVVGVVQESKAEKALEALKKLSAPKAIVLRDGSPREIDSDQVVPGDLVSIDAGRVIPCDLRWVESVNLKVEEASLTGESVPAEKDALAVVEAEAPLGDRVTMGYSSTLSTYGRGMGLAVGTGMDTELGRIAEMLEEEDREETPLQRKLDDFGKKLGIAILALCGVMFVLAAGEKLIKTGRVPRTDLFEFFLTSVSLAVAAIPEGLVAIVTIVLAIGVQLMSREKAIVRRLPAVETLGAVTMICSDKTGTLTRNKMSVVAWSADGARGEASAVDASRPGQRLFLEAFALCNDACLGARGAECAGEGSTGDPTEIALLELARRGGIVKEELLEAAPRVGELPFDSDRKMMSTVHSRSGGRAVMTKGAADRLLERCDRVMEGGVAVVLDGRRKAAILAEAEGMAEKALRVLGAAYRLLGDSEEAGGAGLEEGLVFLGIAGMIDPPRIEVKGSIEICRRSGIGVAMITGDHKATALAIARELEIAREADEALSGTEIDELGEAELEARVGTARVFARVSPEHKVRIVKAFRARGHVVSMTGDGVNDAPSLKAADIGVAMGITGTDVAKGASDMILADDNFKTIVKAIEEGRNIYNNIKKAILYLLSCNVGEVLSVFSAVLVGTYIPLLPVHILWVNLVTDTFPALALGMDPGDPDIIKEPPRDPKESLFAKGGSTFMVLNGLWIGLITVAAFWIGMGRTKSLGLDGEAALGFARTMAFCALSLAQLFHAFNLRNWRKSLFSIGPFANKWLIGAFALGLVLQCGIVLIAPLAAFFKVRALDGAEWLIVIGLAASPLLVNEIVKLAGRLLPRRAGRA
jgi:Ca2+-transporting ATPase